MRVNLGGVGAFVVHGYNNFTLLNKAFVLVKASIPTHSEVRLRFIRETPLAGEQRLRFVFTLKTEIIF
jgi:hypothetical protein